MSHCERSEAKQSYIFDLIDFMRLLHRYASRKDTTPDFLRNHQFWGLIENENTLSAKCGRLQSLDPL